MDKISGKTMMKEMLHHLFSNKAWSKRLAGYHVEMQQNVNFPIRSAKTMLAERINLVTDLSDNERSFVLQYLNTLPDGNRLCHFDFHPDNIMMIDNKPIYIDLMNACAGDPLSNVARTTILLKYSHIPNKSYLMKGIISVMRLRVYNGYIKEYLKLSKVSISGIGKWEFPVMAARLYEAIPDQEKIKLLSLIRKQITALAS